MIKKIGITYLPLHYGYAPKWLFERMVKLGSLILKVMKDEFKNEEILRRISDPFWFQSFTCVLGWDFNSSGSTTVLTAVLKEIFKKYDFGIFVAGGKGKASLRTPNEIKEVGEKINLSEKKIEELIYASKIIAKIDNVALQDGYKLYHHAFIFTENGKYCVIQQGMDTSTKTARRYHWLSEKIENYLIEPHYAICCDIKKENVLDMTSKESLETQKLIVDLVNEGKKMIEKDLIILKSEKQKTLSNFFNREIKILVMENSVNWKAIEKAYNLQVKNFENLIAIEGIGEKTIRSLALISQLIYGKEVSWKDPKTYSFSVGGKDGVPYKINKRHYDEVIETLKEFIKKSELEEKEKYSALKRLANFLNEKS